MLRLVRGRMKKGNANQGRSQNPDQGAEEQRKADVPHCEELGSLCAASSA
jgi:hypothetical protein